MATIGNAIIGPVVNYSTLANLKEYLGITTAGDDAILQASLDRAEAIFAAHFSATFYAQTETRYFGAMAVEDYGRVLWLDKPLLVLDSLTNGNSNAITAYWLLPRNATPYWFIRLKSAANTTFQFNADGEIAVTGDWGYTTTPPDEAVQAVLRLAAYLYRQKDSQVFETTAAPEFGIMTIPGGIPKDVETLISLLRARYALA